MGPGKKKSLGWGLFLGFGGLLQYNNYIFDLRYSYYAVSYSDHSITCDAILQNKSELKSKSISVFLTFFFSFRALVKLYFGE